MVEEDAGALLEAATTNWGEEMVDVDDDDGKGESEVRRGESGREKDAD